MRRPAQIKPWLSEEEFLVWIREAVSREAYKKEGPEGLGRQGRGGRRWSLLSWPQEEALLKSFERRALGGEWITAKQMLPKICQAAGEEVSLAYVYRLLRRHPWRKLGPRPRHVKADPQAQEEFKKNSRSSSKKS